MNLAVIPARGGSKRIPKKNIKEFFGKPIIAYSIEAAQKCKLFDRIIVSTDSSEIAEVAKKYGAEIPFMRPAQLADDLTHTDTVILHALKWLIKNGQKINYVCCIYPTAPFIQPKYLKKGLDLLKRHKVTSVLPLTNFSSSIFRAYKINDEDQVEMIWPKYFKSRSQDLPAAYHDAGQFYWAEVRKYMKEKSFYSSDTIPMILPDYLVKDINTIEDWGMAERMYQANLFAE